MPQTAMNTIMTAAQEGQCVQMIDSLAYVNGEASAEIAFGRMVKQGTLDNEAILLTAETDTDKFLGIVVRSDSYIATTELGTTGLKPDVVMTVLRKGRIWVQVEEAVTPASAVWVRCVGEAGVDYAGQFRDTDDGSDTADISAFAKYLTTTTGAGLALLDIDMTNRNS